MKCCDQVVTSLPHSRKKMKTVKLGACLKLCISNVGASRLTGAAIVKHLMFLSISLLPRKEETEKTKSIYLKS